MYVGRDILLRLFLLVFQSYCWYFPLKWAHNFEYQDLFNEKDDLIIG